MLGLIRGTVITTSRSEQGSMEFIVSVETEERGEISEQRQLRKK